MTSISLVAALDGKLSWYVARSSGIVAWATSAASLLWGLTLSTRGGRRLDLHRFLGTLTVVFTAIHLVALWADDFVVFGLPELFVPMTSEYRPGAVAWGIVATYLLVSIMVTSWAMRWLPRRLWHAVHLSSYGVFALGTMHGYQAGTDGKHVAVLVAGAVASALVAGLTVSRFRRPRQSELERVASAVVA